MKQFTVITLLVISLVVVNVCSMTFPQVSLVNEEYIANPGQFEVIGDVQGVSTIAILFGFIPIKNDRGFLLAYNDALDQARFQGATDLINVFSDVRITSFFGMYHTEQTIVYAKAIKKIQ